MLAGITQKKLQTGRLEMAYLEAGTGDTPIVLVHGNCSSAVFYQEFMVALANIGKYRILAPDLRGYGDSETVAVDATRGVKDYSDDLHSLVEKLDLPPFHLLGWSLGGNIVMQYALDHPDRLHTLTLEAAGSPFGYGGSKGLDGQAIWPDFAGSGGGMANPAFVELIRQGDRGSEPSSPRTVMNTLYFQPPFRVSAEQEEIYLDGLLSTKVIAGNYPGDLTPSANWPHIAPGTQGVNNALSPKYLNQSSLADIEPKLPILWIRGANDQIVADSSPLDFGTLGQMGIIPGWPGLESYPPQPMVSQLRAVLDQYQSNGGEYQEVVLPDCGHAPHIEKAAEFLKIFSQFVEVRS